MSEGLTEDQVLDLIRREFAILTEEYGVRFPIKPIDRLPGAVGNVGASFLVPNSTATFSVVISDGEGNWNELPHTGPVV